MKIKHNQEIDFNLCESNEEAIKSEAWRLWLITVLRSVYSNKEASKYVELLDLKKQNNQPARNNIHINLKYYFYWVFYNKYR